MFDRKAWNREYNLERREWYKAHGICCQCGAAQAEIERTLCAACAKRQYDRQNKHDPGRRNSIEQNRQKRARFYAAGLCTNCGKRPHGPNRKTCDYCAKKQRDRDMDRRVRRRLDRQIENERRRLDDLRRIPVRG